MDIPSCEAHLGERQVPVPCDSREVSLRGEGFPDAQPGKDVFQVEVTGDGELGQFEFLKPSRKEGTAQECNSGHDLPAPILNRRHSQSTHSKPSHLFPCFTLPCIKYCPDDSIICPYL